MTERASVIPNAVLIAKRYAALSAPAQTLTLCFDAHRPDGKVWAVKVGRRWHNVKHLDIFVPMFTVYLGPKARQPRAYLRATGRLIGCGDQRSIVP